jgi:PmbA protein
MNDRHIADSAVKAMLTAGADLGQASFTRGEKTELNVDAGAMSLLRTTIETNLAETAYSKNRKGSSTVNLVDENSIRNVAGEAVDAALVSKADPAYGIAPASAPAAFAIGSEAPDLRGMYDRLAEFLATCKKDYPTVNLEQCVLDFTAKTSYFANSNGVLLSQARGMYSFFAVFTAKEGSKASSFNYSGANRLALDLPFVAWGNVGELMRQASEQMEAKPLDGKFEGDLIIAPYCLGDFLYRLETSYLGDYGLVSGASPYKASFGIEVASKSFSLRSEPVSGVLQDRCYFTEDGFVAEDCPIIEKGILKNSFLSLYGANKTGLMRCPSGGGNLTVDPGDTSLEDLIASTEKGVLLTRFSGGSPSEDGDFSGVAKNSYLIRDGKIERPLVGTMVSGNILKFLREIEGISKERVDFGNTLLPWIKTKGITISGS